MTPWLSVTFLARSSFARCGAASRSQQSGIRRPGFLAGRTVYLPERSLHPLLCR